MKVFADKIASSTRNARLQRELTLSSEMVCREGYIIAAKALTENSSYSGFELVSGRMSRVCKGDILAGVLGRRNALKGFSGVVPESLKPGDVIQVLNMGGVMGQCTSENPELGKPIDIEVLGAVLHFPSFMERVGKAASIHNGSVAPQEKLPESKPLVIVTGTCMNAGKTRAACEVIKYLTQAGKRIGAAKLSGISLMRDTLEMADFGAEHVVNFTDVGIVCSSPENVLPAARGMIRWLSDKDIDAIVLEFGDGIMGEYGVMALLSDAELMSHVKVHIISANDPVAAWGAVQFLEGMCPPIDLICGPTTDNEVGKKFIRENLGRQAANAMREPQALGKFVINRLGFEDTHAAA